MNNKTLLSIRSNCDFSLDYQSDKLNPQTEVILITTSPKYIVNKKKNAIEKYIDVDEFRFKSDLEGINKLIGELQLVVKNMNAFEQTAASFNAIIQSAKEQQEKID